MQTDPIEAMARAIYDGMVDGERSCGFEVDAYDANRAIATATAALDALANNITPEMVEAGDRAIWDDANHMPAIHASEAVFRAMIAAAKGDWR